VEYPSYHVIIKERAWKAAVTVVTGMPTLQEALTPMDSLKK
jgi:hypothetical protein